MHFEWRSSKTSIHVWTTWYVIIPTPWHPDAALADTLCKYHFSFTPGKSLQPSR